MDAHGVVLPQALLRVRSPANTKHPFSGGCFDARTTTPQALPSDPADVLAVSQQIAAFAFATKARAHLPHICHLVSEQHALCGRRRKATPRWAKCARS